MTSPIVLLRRFSVLSDGMLERELIAALKEIIRSTGGPARTIAVATRINLSERQTRRYLTRLEQQQTIQRVGQRCGWTLRGDVYQAA